MFKLFQKIQSKVERGMDKSYVSEATQMMAEFDKSHQKRSDSQRKEVEKHRNIFKRKVKSKIKW